MPTCKTCGTSVGKFTSLYQCYTCSKARKLRRYHARFPEMSDDLYVLRCPGYEDTWKIGRTSCLPRRLWEFNRYVPRPYEVEQVYVAAGAIETKLHRSLSLYRIDGHSREFFQCPLHIIFDAADILVAELRSNTEPDDDHQ